MLCARCHTHPLENWTQADYYGLAQLLQPGDARRHDRALPGVPNTKLVQLNLAAGLGDQPAHRPGRSRRASSAATSRSCRRRPTAARPTPHWLTAPENPFFARGLVNRIWSYFFHRGIIEPVDDIRSTNPPINPALLDALTKDFIEHKFDVRHLMRRIVTSRDLPAQQRAERRRTAHDEQNFSHAIPRRLPAEALLDSLVQATGVPENFGGAPAASAPRSCPTPTSRATSSSCSASRSGWTPASASATTARTCCRRCTSSTARASWAACRTPAAGWRRCWRQADRRATGDGAVSVVARPPPTAEERQLSLAHLQSYGDQRLEAAQDLMWALLNSKEFMFNY